MFDFFKNLLNSKNSDSEYNLDNISEDELNFIDDEIAGFGLDATSDGCKPKMCRANYSA